MAGLVVMTRPWQLALLALLASPTLGLQVQVLKSRSATTARGRASLPTVTMAQEAFEEYETPPQWTRRAAIGGGALSVVSLFETREPKKDSYGLWGTLPIGPYKTKATAPMETIVPGKVGRVDWPLGSGGDCGGRRPLRWRRPQTNHRGPTRPPSYFHHPPPTAHLPPPTIRRCGRSTKSSAS